MRRLEQLMSLVTINWMVQKIIGIHCRSVKRRVIGKRRVAGKRGDDEQCLQAANFHTAKFRRLQKFSQLGKFSGKILLPQY